MLEFVLLLSVLLVASFGFYYLYERYYRGSGHSESSLYVEALRNLLDGKQEAAFTKLRQVVAEDSNNIDAYLRLGQILREHNRADRALQVHKDLTLRFGLSRADKVAILKELASDYIALNELNTSESALKELISLDPTSYWAYAQRLKLQEKAQQWEAAYETATHVLKLESNNSRKPLARYKLMQGEQLYKQREYHKSRLALKEAISLDPGCMQAYLLIGDSYFDEDRFEDAVTFWTKLIAAVPEQAHIVIERLKNTLFTLGRFGDIVEICQKILEHSPKNVGARRALAEFYAKKGDLDSAAEALEQLVDDHPEDSGAVIDLVRIYLEKGDRSKIVDMRRQLERRREKQALAASASGKIVIPAGR